MRLQPVRTVIIFLLVEASGFLLIGVMTWFVARNWGEVVSKTYSTIRVGDRSDPPDNQMKRVNSFGAMRSSTKSLSGGRGN